MTLDNKTIKNNKLPQAGRLFYVLMIIAGTLIFLQSCNKIQSKNCTDWIAKIDNDVICKSDIDAEYDLIIETYAKMQMVDKEKLLEIINDDNAVNQNRMLLQLRKSNFVERFINEYLIYKEALRQNLDKNAKVKIMLHHQEKSILSQAFLEESLQKEISVSDEEVEKYYQNYRKKDPRVGRLPIEQAFKQIRYMLMEQKKQVEVQKKVQDLRDKFKIERNRGVTDSSKPAPQKTTDTDKKADKKPEKK